MKVKKDIFLNKYQVKVEPSNFRKLLLFRVHLTDCCLERCCSVMYDLSSCSVDNGKMVLRNDFNPFTISFKLNPCPAPLDAFFSWALVSVFLS